MKDVDSAARARHAHALGWLAMVGVVAVGAGTAGAMYYGVHPILALLIGLGFALGCALLFYGFVYPFLIGGTAALLGRIYGGGVGGEALPPSYWRADALIANGAYDEALEALDQAAEKHPRDPRPYFRAAKLCLSEMEDPGRAVERYLRARRAGLLDAENDAYVGSRLAEIYESRLDDDGRAVVELRRLIDLYPDSRYARSARARLAELKARLAERASEPDA